MPLESKRAARVQIFILFVILLTGLPLVILAQYPTYPDWWTQRNVTDNSEKKDFAPANQGQLKNLTIAAYEELLEKLPAEIGGIGDMSAPSAGLSEGGTGYQMQELVKKWVQINATTGAVLRGSNGLPLTAAQDPSLPPRNDFAPVNLGQLKAVAKVFYDRLQELNSLDQDWLFPWTVDNQGSPSNDFAAVNLGQLKRVFAFDLKSNPDFDQLTTVGELVYNALNPSATQLLSNTYDVIPELGLTGSGTGSSGTGSSGTNYNGYNPNNYDPNNLANTKPYEDADGDGLMNYIDPNPNVPNPQPPHSFYVTLKDEEAYIAEDILAEDIDWTKIKLIWGDVSGDPDENTTGYILEEKISTGEWHEINTINNIAQKDLIRMGILAYQNYYYRIRSFNKKNGEMAFSMAVQTKWSGTLLKTTSTKISDIMVKNPGFREFIPSSPKKYYLTWNHHAKAKVVSPPPGNVYLDEIFDTISLNPSNNSVTSRHGKPGKYYYDQTYFYPTKLSPIHSLSRTWNNSAYHSSAYHSSYSWWNNNIVENATCTFSQAESEGLHWYGLGEFCKFNYGYGSDALASWEGTLVDHYYYFRSYSPYSGITTNTTDRVLSSQSTIDGWKYLGTRTETIYDEWPTNLVNTTTTTSVEEGLPTYGNFPWYHWVQLPHYFYQTTPIIHDVSATVDHYDRSGAEGDFFVENIRTVELSNEYLNTQFITDASNNISDYPSSFTNYSNGPGFYYPNTLGGVLPYQAFGWWYNLIDDGIMQIGRAQYKLKTNPSIPATLTWWEVLIPYDSTRPPKFIAKREMNVGPEATESAVYEIDPRSRDDGDGGYHLAFPPMITGSSFWSTRWSTRYYQMDAKEREANGVKINVSNGGWTEWMPEIELYDMLGTGDWKIAYLDTVYYSYDGSLSYVWDNPAVRVFKVMQDYDDMLNNVFYEELTQDSVDSWAGKIVVCLDLSIASDLSVNITQNWKDGTTLLNTSKLTVAVQLNAELIVDGNRDGEMSFDVVDPEEKEIHDKDITSSTKLYTFWVNNDWDKGGTVDIWDWEEDDYPHYQDRVDDVIEWRRDLEDFTRLWINCKGITGFVKQADFKVRLEWKPLNGDANWSAADGRPGIRVFKAVEEQDGGRKYLEDDGVAWQQIDGMEDSGNRNNFSKAVGDNGGLVTRDQFLELPGSFFTNLDEDQPCKYLLFEGYSAGKGQLVLTLYKGETKVGECPPVFLELKHVRDMYERWSVGDVISKGVNPNAWPAALPTLQPTISQKPYKWPHDETKDYILSVHGWNMSSFDKESFGDTNFKRLWHRGYKGRMGYFSWPTFHSWPSWDSASMAHYDSSELRAWNSGKGLLALLGQINNKKFSGRIRMMAHSMGNVVAASALRLANNQRVVHTYVAAQAAIPAHCYNPTTPLMTSSSILKSTPNVYGYYWQNGTTLYPDQYEAAGLPSFLAPSVVQGAAGKFINYFNGFDWALGYWQINQQTKPNARYSYFWNTLNVPGGRAFLYTPGPIGTNKSLHFPQDTYEIYSFAAASHSYALGRSVTVGGVFDNTSEVNLNAKWGYDHKHKGHSAQFRSTNMRRWEYWEQLLSSFGISQP